MSPLVLGLLALLLGFKHAYDADHLVAVSNILARNRSIGRSARLSVVWAVGHMATATIVTVLLYLGGRPLLGSLFEHFDLAVGLMLILIGMVSLLAELSVIHTHRHAHGRLEHEHAHAHVLERIFRRQPGSLAGGAGSRKVDEHRIMLGVGVVHGLASNDELLVLFAAALSVTSLAGILVGVAVFSVGVVAGMIVFAVGLTLPMMRWGELRVRRAVTLAAASASVGYGALLLAGFEGMNALQAIGL